MTKPTINDPRWQEWADKFLAAPTADPGPDKSGMVVGFFLTRRSLDEEELAAMGAEFNENFIYKVGVSHAQRIGLNLDEEGMQFLSLIAENLGDLVMHIHGARRLQQKLGQDKLSMQELFESAFTGGTRSNAILQALWDEQKLSREEREALGGGMDNYLDHVLA